MQFTKIKYDGKKVELTWKTKTEHDEVEHHIVSDEPPDVDLVTAFVRMATLVVDVLAVPERWGAELKVTGLSISTEDDGCAGLVITARTPLAATKAPFNFSLPCLREHPEGQEAKGYFLPGMSEAIDDACAAAERFVAGHRAQQELAL